jgi:hypothetical protein
MDVYHTAMLARHSSTRGSAAKFDTKGTTEEILAAPLGRWVDEIRELL